MKVVIFAGGHGTRIMEESKSKPKPLIEIGDKPILWHIMKLYSHYGFNDFIILAGYKQEMIKKYFQDFFLANSDVTYKYGDSCSTQIHNTACEKWNVTIIDTGLNTMTGGRLKRIKKYLGTQPFLLTYGDGVGDVNLPKLIEQHKASKALVTMTAYKPIQQFGTLEFNENTTCVKNFKEKIQDPNQWINAGFFVVNPAALDYISGDEMPWEEAPLKNIANEGGLHAYKHEGFWKCMDTMKDKDYLIQMWETGIAKWKVWK
jgi:glucose-1-phosphate cytidylyltransferase